MRPLEGISCDCTKSVGGGRDDHAAAPSSLKENKTITGGRSRKNNGTARSTPDAF
jgi:hypothetical protein